MSTGLQVALISGLAYDPLYDCLPAFTAATGVNVNIAVFNLHGETISIAEVVAEIERVSPNAAGTITYPDEPLAIPAEMDDHAIRAALGDLPATPLTEGVHATIERFAELEREGRLDTSDLDC
jgi:nucleoside-diphosphate-sugar epimerase